MKYLNKLAELVIAMVLAISVAVMLVAVVVACRVDCTKNDNGTYSCSTEVSSDE